VHCTVPAACLGTFTAAWECLACLKRAAYLQVAELEALQAVYPEAGAVEEDVPGLLLRVQQVADLPTLALPPLDCLPVRAFPAQVAQERAGARYVYQRSCKQPPWCSCCLYVSCCRNRRTAR